MRRPTIELHAGPPPLGAPGAPTVRVTSSLGALAPSWDELVLTAPLPTPFLLSWWLAAHEGAPGAAYVLVERAGALVGGLPVQLDRWSGLRRLRLLGAGPLAPDHLDLVAAPDAEDVVVEQLGGWLRDQQPVFVDLQGLAPNARAGRLLTDRSLETDLSAAPFVPLPPVGAGPVSPRAHRRDLRKQCARLERRGAWYRQVAGDDRDFPRALDSLRSLHVERWGARSGFARSFDRFALAAGGAGPAVRIHELVAGARVVATEVSLDAGRRRHRYQVGRTGDRAWNGAGNALLAHVVARTQAEGFEELDFLRGREAYKYAWAGVERPVRRLRDGLGPGPRAALAVVAQAERARPLARVVKAELRQRRPRR